MIPPPTRSLTRRHLLAATAALVGAGLTGPAEAGVFFWGRLFSVPPRDTPFLTPNDQFYRVNYSDHSLELAATVRSADWSLRLHGAVEHPRTFQYVDLLEQRTMEQMVTLQCIDNEPGGSLMSNALWTGFPLARVLEAAKPLDTAMDVVFHSLDGYHDSITLDRALRGDALLAHSMNGVPLPKDHGYPLRAIVPGVFGIKNVKWLTEIEVVERDHKGYWQERGWTDEGLIPVTSRIDSPGHYQLLRGGRQEIRGIAFAGLHGIKRVEVSVDGGRTWRDAILAPVPRYAWVPWSYEWRVPAAGAHTIAVRAEGLDGVRQVEVASRAYPSGTSGLHTIVALVESV
ncbi:MAG TPA: molybdopterin-dependent oxidoreductase [Nitrospiria bacterium]|nr:molybdopterin-dependent oxidoreductase [Nitrospiria bacterium]